MAKWNELTRVQMPALVHLTRIGYTYYGKLTEEDASKGVYDPDTNILIQVFKEQFAKLNPQRKGEAEQMLQNIRQELDNDDIGESFYNRLKTVVYFRQGNQIPCRILFQASLHKRARQLLLNLQLLRVCTILLSMGNCSGLQLCSF